MAMNVFNMGDRVTARGGPGEGTVSPGTQPVIYSAIKQGEITSFFTEKRCQTVHIITYHLNVGPGEKLASRRTFHFC